MAARSLPTFNSIAERVATYATRAARHISPSLLPSTTPAHPSPHPPCAPAPHELPRPPAVSRTPGVPPRKPDPLPPEPRAIQSDQAPCVLQLQAATRIYGEHPPVPALQSVSFSVRRGELLAIVGPSGSGKSTLLHIMGTLERPTSGVVRIAGVDAATLSDRELSVLRAQEIGFVFQQFFLAEHASVRENVADGLLYAGVPAAERYRRADEALDRVGLSHRASFKPTRLSGGERQRVAIARALVGRPSIILADEPTGNLDSATGGSIVALIRELHAAGATIILITHDAALADDLPRQIQILDGRIVSDTAVQLPQQKNPPASRPTAPDVPTPSHKPSSAPPPPSPVPPPPPVASPPPPVTRPPPPPPPATPPPTPPPLDLPAPPPPPEVPDVSPNLPPRPATHAAASNKRSPIPPTSPQLRPADALRVASIGVRFRPLRFALSALGIAIGTAAIVAVLGLSASSQAGLIAELNRLGTNLLTVEAGRGFSGQEAKLPSEAPARITHLANVDLVAHTAMIKGANVYRTPMLPVGNTGGVQVRATSLNLLPVLSTGIARGTWLNEATAQAPVAVLGSAAAQRLGIDQVYPDERIWLGKQWFNIAGILQPTPLAPEIDSSALIGYPSAKKYLGYLTVVPTPLPSPRSPSASAAGNPILPPPSSPSAPTAQEPSVAPPPPRTPITPPRTTAHEPCAVPPTSPQAPPATHDVTAVGPPTSIYVRTATGHEPAVQSLLAQTANPESPNEVNVSRPSEILTARAAAAGAFNSLFLGLGVVALTVGAVGVANIMIISVLERRSEIGLRRALGATQSQIRTQFLCESILLAMIGGIAGTLSGAAATAIYATAKNWSVVIPLEAWSLGIAAALLIGALAGLLPAIRASRLPPTVALRTV